MFNVWRLPETVVAQWARTRLAFTHSILLLLYFDAHSFPHAFEDHINCLDDFELRVCFAVNNQLVLGFPAFSDVHVVPFRESVVPTAVPRTQEVRLILPCPGELGACQRLNVEKSLRVGILTQVYLSFGA